MRISIRALITPASGAGSALIIAILMAIWYRLKSRELKFIHLQHYCSKLNSQVQNFMDSAFQDELIWAAAWLFKATNRQSYMKYVVDNIHYLENSTMRQSKEALFVGGSFAEFGWDAKHAGINVLISRVNIQHFFSPLIIN